MPMQQISPLRNRFLALRQYSSLSTHFSQTRNDAFIPIHKPHQRIRNPHILAELLHQLLRLPQIVPRHPRIQVMDGLELQSTVHPVKPLWAIDIHGCAQHFLWEGFVGSHIGGGHGEMGDCDLDVEHHREHVRGHDERKPGPAGGDVAVNDAVAVPQPEDALAEDFKVAMPPGRAFLRAETFV